MFKKMFSITAVLVTMLLSLNNIAWGQLSQPQIAQIRKAAQEQVAVAMQSLQGNYSRDAWASAIRNMPDEKVGFWVMIRPHMTVMGQGGESIQIILFKDRFAQMLMQRMQLEAHPMEAQMERPVTIPNSADMGKVFGDITAEKIIAEMVKQGWQVGGGEQQSDPRQQKLQELQRYNTGLLQLQQRLLLQQQKTSDPREASIIKSKLTEISRLMDNNNNQIANLTNTMGAAAPSSATPRGLPKIIVQVQ